MEELAGVMGTQMSILAQKMLQRGKHEETLRRA